MVTCGIDLSITGTGIAVWNGEEVLYLTRVHTPGPSKAVFEARVRIIRRYVMREILAYKPTLVAIEGAAYGRPNQAFALGELAGVIKYSLHQTNQAFVLVAPTRLKKFATGKGNATKYEVVQAAYPYLGHREYSHDEADAFFLAKFAYDNYADLVE